MIRQNGASGGLSPDDSGAKDGFRRKLAGLVLALSSDDKQARSRLICERVATLDAFERAKQVLLYRALNDEVAIETLESLAVQGGKELFLPRSVGGHGFAAWRPGEPLVRGPSGTFEPGDEQCPDDGPGLVVVPGRGYDPAGRRLGRGGGWYDRALAELPGSICIVGVAFACQIVERIPEEPHDRRMDYVVTEEATTLCGERNW